MTPIHAPDGSLVGWYDGTHVFDRRLEWVAFQRGGHLFSCRDAEWLGPLGGGSLLDRSGRVVAWLAGSVPAGALAPGRPMRPQRPLPPRRPLYPPEPGRPGMPASPVGGWSALGWLEWLGLAPPPAPAPAPEAQAPGDEAGEISKLSSNPNQSET